MCVDWTPLPCMAESLEITTSSIWMHTPRTRSLSGGKSSQPGIDDWRSSCRGIGAQRGSANPSRHCNSICFCLAARHVAFGVNDRQQQNQCGIALHRIARPFPADTASCMSIIGDDLYSKCMVGQSEYPICSCSNSKEQLRRRRRMAVMISVGI